MKKKNLKLGKLNLSKSRISSLDNISKAKGGTQGPTIFDYGCGTVGPNCSIPCATQNNCPPPPSNNCGTQFPQCQATQGFSCGPACFPTEQNCVTQQTCGGNFLCDNQIF